MRKSTKRFPFKMFYPSGEEVRARDRVVALGLPALVEAVFRPKSRLGRNMWAGNKGGIILQFDNGNLEVSFSTEGQIELVERG